ncbi:tyrosine-type recombinase/integrase [Enterococcus faecalis]|nr:site-specific integrase [Enterococcus faecalis]TQA62447.1 site-specific integrase [Enterococcus faecalis]
METKDRFKKNVNATGEITWYFQAFRTTRRGFKTKREAQLAYLDMEKIYRAKKKLTGSRETFNDVSEKWFAHYKSLQEQKKSTYVKRYDMIVSLSRWIGDKKISDLTSDFLEDFFFELKEKGIDGESKGYSKNSLEGYRQTLNMIFNYCVRYHVLSHNPLKTVNRPKYQKSVADLKASLNSLDQKYLTFDEVKLLLNYSLVNEELTLATLFHVLFYTGCRISEALALQPEDIDFKTNEILFYKQTSVSGKQIDFTIETTKSTASARRVVVTPLVMEKLKELIEVLEEFRSRFKFQVDDFYLFVYLEPSKRGVPFRREYVNDHIKKCVQRCGITKPFHTHLTRHTMASLVADYCSWDVLKARLGHADKTTSEIYRHLTSEERLKPLEAFKTLES